MRRRTRTFRSAGIDGVAEDLRILREVGGLAGADDEALTCTLLTLWPELPTYDADAVGRAKAILTTEIEEELTRLAVIADGRVQASVMSLRVLLIQPDSALTKVDAVRRRALRSNGCDITPDALRKREDIILRAIGAAVVNRAGQRRDADLPLTVEEVVLPAVGLLRDIFERLELHLQVVYQHTNHDREYYRFALRDGLYAIAQLKRWALRLQHVAMAPHRRSPTDVIWQSLATFALQMVFESDRDRDLLITALSAEPETSLSFLEALRDLPDSRALLEEWERFFTGCHPTCSYRRSPSFDGMCVPHQLVASLDATCEAATLILSGMAATEAIEEAFGVSL